MTPEEPALDIDRLIEVLDRYDVTYLLVGGVSAIAHGATRPTNDFDCVVERGQQNLTRLAEAMRELNARIRAEGLSDEDAKTLPTQIDAQMFGAMEISTWCTDAGNFDVLAEIPDRDGHRLRYGTLAERATALTLSGHTVVVAGLDDVIASKEWADRPKDHEALPELRRLRDAQNDEHDPAKGP